MVGPHRARGAFGLSIEHLANHRGGSCYFVDMDPRWVKKLIVPENKSMKSSATPSTSSIRPSRSSSTATSSACSRRQRSLRLLASVHVSSGARNQRRVLWRHNDDSTGGALLGRGGTRRQRLASCRRMATRSWVSLAASRWTIPTASPTTRPNHAPSSVSSMPRKQTSVMDYGEYRPCRTDDAYQRILHATLPPSVTKRSGANRTHLTPWDGVGDVRPFGAHGEKSHRRSLLGSGHPCCHFEIVSAFYYASRNTHIEARTGLPEPRSTTGDQVAVATGEPLVALYRLPTMAS